MLHTLRIQNLAVIADAELEFDLGFTALTGETGAGKSIIIDAISLLLGAPADEGLIRTGSDAAVVEGVFTISAPIPELSQYIDDSLELIVYRRISRRKPSVARINGQSVSLKQLKATLKSLVGITGQHDQLGLFSADTQLKVVDQFIPADRYAQLMTTFRSVYADWAACRAKLTGLQSDAHQLAQKIAFLQFQIDDISQYEFAEDEESRLLALKRSVNQQTQIATQLDDASGALDRMMAAAQAYVGAFKKINPVPDPIGPLVTAAPELIAQLEDYSLQLSRFQAEMADLTDVDIDAVESRLDVIFKLKTKYKMLDLPALVSHLNSLITEREALVAFDTTAADLDAQLAQLTVQISDAADALHHARVAAAANISQAVQGKLSELGFNQAVFHVDAQIDLVKLGSNGATAIEMRIAPNPGEPPKPLGKIASGGELSRIMLAINAVLFEMNPTPTLIFDEVDAGVGGLTALKIGELLRLISQNAQVFCITHLPQIAKKATHHWVIEKVVRENQTYTQVSPLSDDDRPAELRRMVGGDEVVEWVQSPPSLFPIQG